MIVIQTKGPETTGFIYDTKEIPEIYWPGLSSQTGLQTRLMSNVFPRYSIYYRRNLKKKKLKLRPRKENKVIM